MIFKDTLPPEIYQALVLAALAIIAAMSGLAVAFLNRLTREQQARHEKDEIRDLERNELVQNVRRIANGNAIVHDTPSRQWDANRTKPDRRLGPRRASDILKRRQEDGDVLRDAEERKDRYQQEEQEQ